MHAIIRYKSLSKKKRLRKKIIVVLKKNISNKSTKITIPIFIVLNFLFLMKAINKSKIRENNSKIIKLINFGIFLNILVNDDI